MRVKNVMLMTCGLGILGVTLALTTPTLAGPGKGAGKGARQGPTTAPAATELNGTSTINGVVMGADGKPSGQAIVRLMKVNRGAPRDAAGGRRGKRARGNADGAATAPAADARREVITTVATDEIGQFTLSSVPAGQYVLLARVPGKGVARTQISVGEGQTATAQLHLQAAPERGERPTTRPSRKK